MKSIIKKISILTVCACLAGMVFVQPAFAAGGAYVSNTSIDVIEGETAYIAVGADNAVGAYNVYSNGNASANGGGWLENETATIGIYGAAVGSGTVTIRFDTLATFDGEDMDGTTLDVYVNVIPADGGAAPPEKGGEEQQPQEEQPAEPETETTAAPVVNKLQVAYNGANYLIQNDLTGIELPSGFKEAEGTYNGEKVKVLDFNNELKLYVLRSEADGSIVFLTYDEKTKQFMPPRTIVQDKTTYYLLDVPESVKVPDDYLKKVVRINNFDVKGIVPRDSKKQDIAYIRAMVNGEAGYYAYDMTKGSFQRAADFEALLKGNAGKPANTGLSKKTLAIIIAGVALLLVVVLIIILVTSRKRRRRHRSEDHYPDSFFTESLDKDEDEPELHFERDILEEDLSGDFRDKDRLGDTRKYSLIEKERIKQQDTDDFDMEIESFIDEDFD